MLRERFDRYFEIVTANTPELLRQAYRIRYQVYCVEHPFEKSAEHPDQLEVDAFDDRAIHSLILHRATGDPAGTVRLIRPDPRRPEGSFSLQQLVEPGLLERVPDFPIRSMAEISRFSISKTFRRRAGDTLYGENIPQTPEADEAGRRSGPLMRLGLMQAILSMSRTLGITHWCAVMEPTLLRILAATAIEFTPIGPKVEYHGLRQPCYGDIGSILTRLRACNPEVFDLVTIGGSLCEGMGWMKPEPLWLEAS
ncbi:MAG TPA: PEP-CTERM/exosortase system-associated acyltransferase [Alphaproteobacteria bacterium]|nr:PEP-CTERM/exosortase system-associated acyltransferase [Alphaproteobacteria bacterium]